MYYILINQIRIKMSHQSTAPCSQINKMVRLTMVRFWIWDGSATKQFCEVLQCTIQVQSQYLWDLTNMDPTCHICQWIPGGLSKCLQNRNKCQSDAFWGEQGGARNYHVIWKWVFRVIFSPQKLGNQVQF